MKRAKRAIVMMVFAVTVGCTNQLLPATPPPPAAEALPVYHTNDTFRLATNIATSTYESEHNVVFELHSGNHHRMLSQLDNDEIDYFITHHNPISTSQQRWSAPLAQDGIAFIVHPSNPVSNISNEQLRRIYRGFLTNWSEIGGDDAEIVLYSRESGAALRLEFDRLVMGQQRTSPNALVLSSSQLMIEQIASDPHSIGYIPISSLTNQTTLAIETILPSLTSIADSSYPLRSTIYVIGREEPSSTYRDLFIWIQNGGQEALSSIYAPLPR